MPSWISTTGKLISQPSRVSASRRSVKSCFWWTGASDSTDWISTMTLSSTIRSARKRLLAHRAETAPAQFIRPDCIVYGFQPARAERRMNAIGGVDDFLGNGSRSYQPSLVSRQDAKTPSTPSTAPGLVDSIGRLTDDLVVESRISEEEATDGNL